MKKTAILLGDEAVSMGAIASGISGVYGYPGTPSTEIFESIKRFDRDKNVHARWSTNEKAAYEEALGMSYAGKRALITMKHVGLNVAADAFMNSAITGVNGGLVIAVADDPGMHSSQNEQDSRYFGDFAMIPVLEPSNQQEAYDMTREAFDLSEKLNVPVMLRLVTRLAHSRANIEVEPENRNENALNPSKDQPKWTLLPVYARQNYSRLTKAQASFDQESEKSAYNKLNLVPGSKKGIIVTGIAINYLHENLADSQNEYSILTIRQYPAPTEKIRQLVNHADEILVLEEGYPFIEQRLRGFMEIEGKTIKGKLSGDLPRTGELDPDLARKALGLQAHDALVSHEELAKRPPQLCTGCPHAFTFDALRDAMKTFSQGDVFGDIGCYTLAALPPYNAIQSCVDMGASISMSAGAAHAGVHPSVAAIGDSTFTHSGMTPLLDAVDENTPMTVLILDNSTTAMTGGQKSAATGEPIFNIVKGLGVPAEHVIKLDPLPKKHDENVEKLKKELDYKGLSVVVAQRECLESLKKSNKKKAQAK